MFPRWILTLCLALLATFHVAMAQTYPSKPINLIVPAAAGGATSTTAFLISEGLRERLKQPVVIDHKAGANGVIGTGAAARAAGDGYTLLLATMSHITINPGLYKNLAYDTSRDLKPITMTSTFPLLLVVSPAVPVSSLKELIAFAKANPGRLNYGSSGQGNSNHLAAELLSSQAGIHMVHVPFKGGSGLVTATMTNEVALTFGTPQTTITHINSGKLRVLAVSSAKRSALYPQLPTIAESGLPGFAVDSWNGVFAPAGTPDSVITTLNSEIAKVVQMPSSREAMFKAGMEPVVTKPAEFSAIIKRDTQRWAKVIREKGISID